MELRLNELINLKKQFPCEFAIEITKAIRHSKDHVEMKLNSDLKSKEDIKQWLEGFSEKSETSWSTYSKLPDSGKRVVYKLTVSCVSNKKGIATNVREINCPARIIFTIKRISSSNYKRSDRVTTCSIHLNLHHKHETNTSDTLKIRPLSDTVRSKLLTLYLQGYSVPTAREVLKFDILQIPSENCEDMLLDPSLYPTKVAIRQLFIKEFESDYGRIDANHEFLVEKLNAFNSGEVPSVSGDVSKEKSLIAICTPLMRRAHRLNPESGQVVYIYPSNAFDGHRTFLLLTHSESGLAMPLGAIITSAESTAAFVTAFRKLKDLIGEEGFFGSTDGPSIFLTEDYSLQGLALLEVWPKAKCLLITFLVLHSAWRYLKDARYLVRKEDRVHLYQCFKRIAHARTESECCESFESLESDPKAKNNGFVFYLKKKFWHIKEKWALCWRKSALSPFSDATNSSQAPVCIIKDRVLEQVKFFNVVQMTDFVNTSLERYYEERLLDAVHGRVPPRYTFDRTWLPPTADLLDNIQSMGDNMYVVPKDSGNGTYAVDADLGMCECTPVSFGALCKHQLWVSMKHDVNVDVLMPISDEERSRLYLIAKGEQPETATPMELEASTSDGQSPYSTVYSACLAEADDPLSLDSPDVKLSTSPLQGVKMEHNDTDVEEMKYHVAEVTAILDNGMHQIQLPKILLEPTAITESEAIPILAGTTGSQLCDPSTAEQEVVPRDLVPTTAPHVLDALVSKMVDDQKNMIIVVPFEEGAANTEEILGV